MPIRLEHGQEVMSGSTNAGEAFDLRVIRAAADSTCTGIVRLIEAAQASKAPMARPADRYTLERVDAEIGLSILGMIAAAFGYLTPVQGALVQEVIDVAVILNALRALRIAPRVSGRNEEADAASATLPPLATQPTH
ncbi:hypothetical protein [Tabrizicola sp.]|uniref:P-type ATPase n=1 Tax=Tabrizicola sp. TaxID=2005166 RepID=UPI00386F6249